MKMIAKKPEVFSMTLKKKTAIITEKCIAPDGIAYSKDKDIADKCNGYFIAARLPRSNDNPTEFENNNARNFLCIPTSLEEVINVILESKSKQYTGADNIDSDIV